MPRKEKKTESSFNQLLQGLSLNQLKADFENLQRLIVDKEWNARITKIIKELDDFNSILHKKKSYTQDEVDNLAKLINEFSTDLNKKIEELKLEAQQHLENKKEELVNKFGRFGLYAFKNVQDEANIFSKHLEIAKNHLNQAEKNLNHLTAKSHGYERTPLAKLASACHRVRKSFTSFYGTITDILQHGRNAQALKTIKDKISWSQKATEEEPKAEIFKRKKKWI